MVPLWKGFESLFQSVDFYLRPALVFLQRFQNQRVEFSLLFNSFWMESNKLSTIMAISFLDILSFRFC